MKRLHQWTENYYEASKSLDEKQIYPICVPTYKRGESSSTLKMLEEFKTLKVYVFGYEDDFENYKAMIERNEHFTFIPCRNFKGIAPKRKFINEYMNSIGVEKIFQIDDDITALYFTKHGRQKKDPTKYKAEKVKISILDFFRMWQYILENQAKTEIGVCGVIPENGAWAQNLETMKDIISVACSNAIFYMNIKVLAQQKVEFRTDDKTWEDFDFCLRVLNAGLDACQIRFLTFATPTMTPGTSVATSQEDGWAKRSVGLYASWGEYIRFKKQKETLNAKVRWIRVRKDLQNLGRLNIVHNEEYMKRITTGDIKQLKEYVYSQN